MAARRREKVDPFLRKVGPSLVELTDAMIEDEQPSVLAVAPDGTIQIGKFTLTPKGLVAGDDVGFEEWQQLGEVLQRFEASIQWLIGDWMAFGERRWGQTYEQVASATGYEVTTLYNFASVARSINFSLRSEKLSFGHHRLVVSMAPDLQRQWLEYGEVNNLSISQMRKAIEGKPPTLLDGQDPVSKFQRAFLPFQQRINRVLRKAGQGDRRKIANWLRQEADRIERGDE